LPSCRAALPFLLDEKSKQKNQEKNTLLPALVNAKKNHTAKNAEHPVVFSKHCQFTPALSRIFFWPTRNKGLAE